MPTEYYTYCRECGEISNHTRCEKCEQQLRVPFQIGDIVTHKSGKWGSNTKIVSRVDSGKFPEDPICFFVNGGFWRSSQLAKVPPIDAPPFDSPELGGAE